MRFLFLWFQTWFPLWKYLHIAGTSLSIKLMLDFQDSPAKQSCQSWFLKHVRLQWTSVWNLQRSSALRNREIIREGSEDKRADLTPSSESELERFNTWYYKTLWPEVPGAEADSTTKRMMKEKAEKGKWNDWPLCMRWLCGPGAAVATVQGALEIEMWDRCFDKYNRKVCSLIRNRY